jgi:hypothetical protein
MTNKDKMVEAGACVPKQPKPSKDLFRPGNFSVFLRTICVIGQYIRVKHFLNFILVQILISPAVV